MFSLVNNEDIDFFFFLFIAITFNDELKIIIILNF